jgi:hypothetical protein
MYYFENDVSDFPRGIIDLELYTRLSKEDNILRLSTADEDRLRSFFFEDDDSEYLNDWIHCLQRERYHAVCDERNAYQQMQLAMTGALDTESSKGKSSELEKEAMEQELKVAVKLAAESQEILRAMLIIVGVSSVCLITTLSCLVHKYSAVPVSYAT